MFGGGGAFLLLRPTMKRLAFLLSSFVLLHSASAQDGFKPLFNGKDLTGWDGDLRWG